jgi:hypothetical protein
MMMMMIQHEGNRRNQSHCKLINENDQQDATV